MRLPAVLILVAGLSGPGFACGTGGSQMVAKEPTDLQIFATLEPINVSKPFGLDLILCGDATDLTVEADAWMPRHKHGMNYAPVVHAEGDGKFNVSNLVFHMPGLWQVRVEVRNVDDAKPNTFLLDVEVK